ncbi:hypothetical protein HID58_025656 [Brassica napus]|uniref:Uncharacterized protein n=3 Tax=Brassica TaxID=3705 RepID=A0ABQ8CLS6_BRANA|nr:hypothetical protein HID58_025656 [Brassica napus]
MRWWMRRKKTTPFVKKMRGGPTGSSKRQKLQALEEESMRPFWRGKWKKNQTEE